MRYVIRTSVQLGEQVREIEITLTDRDTMLFRMLLGRQAMRGLRVIPDASFLLTPALSAAEAAEHYARPDPVAGESSRP